MMVVSMQIARMHVALVVDMPAVEALAAPFFFRVECVGQLTIFAQFPRKFVCIPGFADGFGPACTGPPTAAWKISRGPRRM